MDFSHWSANAAVLAAYAVVAVTHLLGMRDAATDARRQGRSLEAGLLTQAVIFQIGLLMVVLALVSPMGYYAHQLIWVRNIQDVVLAVVAPALIVLGAPWLPLARGIGLGRRRPHQEDESAVGGSSDGETGGRSAQPGWRALPVLVTALFCVTWWVWHLPGPFDAALRSPVIYAAEVVTYLAVGIGFWLQLIGSRPLSPQMAPLNRVALLVAAAASGTVLGLIRAYGPGVAYPAYLGLGHSVSSVVSSQQAGGAILWVFPLIPFSIVAVALAVRWLEDDEAGVTAADFDRLLKHKSAWPSRPGLR
jgi:cytochrome c oxidase assembly factor CtaG